MADQPSLNVLGFGGQPAQVAFNRMLLRAAVELAPPGMTIDTYELDAIPLYNGDVEAQGDPAPVGDFKDAIGRADADPWSSRRNTTTASPACSRTRSTGPRGRRGRSVLNGSRRRSCGATPGAFGTTRAQLQLRQAFLFTQTLALLQPGGAGREGPREVRRRGTAGGRDHSQVLVRQLLEALPAWVARVRPA